VQNAYFALQDFAPGGIRTIRLKTERITKSRLHMKRKPTAKFMTLPFKQGDLDGLCGIYAIVNSVRLLCHEANRTVLSSLFKVLVRALKQVLDKPLATVWSGLDWRTLSLLVGRSITYVRRRLGIRLRAAMPPKLLRRAASVNRVWHGLGKGLNRNRVAIVCIDGAISHWTVVRAVTVGTLRLFDSSGLHTVRKSCCSTVAYRKRYQLDPSAIMFIERIN
jgi:hypothetical protein